MLNVTDIATLRDLLNSIDKNANIEIAKNLNIEIRFDKLAKIDIIDAIVNFEKNRVTATVAPKNDAKRVTLVDRLESVMEANATYSISELAKLIDHDYRPVRNTLERCDIFERVEVGVYRLVNHRD